MTTIMQWWGVISGYLPLMLKASLLVVESTVCIVLISWGVGLLLALCRTSSTPYLWRPAEFYIWFIRGTPALIQIFIVYFGLPQFGLRFSPFVAGAIALGLNSAAYVAETIRAGFLGIPKGQRESALALGMSHTTALRRIILPQVVRIIIPPISNEVASALKNTSLLSTITLMELTLQTEVIVATTFRPFQFYILAAILYLILTTAALFGLRRLEVRFALRY
jgi:polar amino acid transport system permease protein